MSQWCSWWFFDVIFVFGLFLYGLARGQRRKRLRKAEGGGESGKILLFCLLTPSPIDFWVDLGSAFARLHLLLYEPKRKEQKKPPATQAMSALRRESLSYSREIYNHVHRK